MRPTDVHPAIARHMLADGLDLVVDLSRSHGPYIHDDLTERDYLDFSSFVATMPIGFNHPKMLDPAFREAIGYAALFKPTCSDFYTVPMAEFVETFARIAKPAAMRHVFFISGGALAVENALKAAFDWKVRKNLARGKGERGSRVIHFRDAFHGRSGYTLSMTNTSDPRKWMYFPRFDWPRVVNPKLRFPVTGDVLRGVIETEAAAVRQIEAAVAEHPDDIAALIVEPIQGEGGDNHFRPEFFAGLRRLADEHEFLFIVDEVQSGMGLTGLWWAVEHMGVEPDLIAFGKKSQVAGVLAGPRVDEVESNCFREPGRISSTFGGDLVDMIRCTRYLEIVDEDRLLENAASVGAMLLEGLESMAAASGAISNARGRGLMLAFDLPNGERRDQMLSNMLANGLLALRSGDRSVRLRPMLDLPADAARAALTIIAQSIPAG